MTIEKKGKGEINYAYVNVGKDTCNRPYVSSRFLTFQSEVN